MNSLKSHLAVDCAYQVQVTHSMFRVACVRVSAKGNLEK